MSNSYRIRTQVGVDKAVNVLLEQDFESLEILSLKILQSQIYNRQCSDYGVVVGRVSANNGFGIPNAKVSIFIPLSLDDESNPTISELYPYKTLNDLNEDGYRYNLLPYEVSHGGHTPTGTFPSREDVLVNQSLIEVFDKYYKFTAKTNDSGDFMIFGVPIGSQTVHMDVDLSDIGEFSLSPQDLIRLNLATEGQLNGTKFKSSTNLGELPQIKQANRTIEVVPLWGQPEICYLGITRIDFDLSQEFGIKIEPAAIFMGSILSNTDENIIKRNCKANKKIGNLCSMVTGPGRIISIRQTIELDNLGRPLLEEFDLENGGNCIDEEGTWLIDLPMNLDYIYTSESGERLISTNKSIGIPTRARYRFKISWQQPPTITGKILRASYLVPNIKEWGWTGTSYQDPLLVNYEDTGNTTGVIEILGDIFGVCRAPEDSFLNQETYKMAAASYAFSVDWEEYGAGPDKNQMILEAITCQDRFFEFRHSKVYTVSSLITEFRAASNNDYRYLAIKDILNSECESTTNTFPANDGQKNNDIIYLLFSILMTLMVPVMFVLMLLSHFVTLIFCILAFILGALKVVICGIADFLNLLGDIPLLGLPFRLAAIPFEFLCNPIEDAYDKMKEECGTSGLQLPVFVYPDCNFCECAPLTAEKVPADLGDLGYPGLNEALQAAGGTSLLQDFHSPSKWECSRVPQLWYDTSGFGLPEIETTPIAGEDISNNIGALQTGGPALSGVKVHAPIQQDIIVDDGEAGGRGNVDAWKMFTTSIPFFERINLLNTKAKYFSPTANPGGGRNRIRVKFASDNASNTGFHEDNVLILFVKPSQLGNFESGKIFSPVEKDFSQDLNLNNTSLTEETQFGNFSTTGTTLGTPVLDSNGNITHFERDIDVYYANASGIGNTGPINYTITASTGDLGTNENFYKFPSDIEYFQVITGLTVADYISFSNTGSTSETIRGRILGSYMDIVHDLFDSSPTGVDIDNATQLYYDPDTTNGGFSMGDASGNPTRWNCQKDAQEIGIVFLVRGVDPYSSRQTCSYDLSLLFGHTSWLTPGLTIEGQFKLNIPIQGNIRNVRHGTSSITNNTSIDTYSGIHLFYPSYSFSPDTTMYQQYTTTATSYYLRGDFADTAGIGTVAAVTGISGLRVSDNNWFTRQFWERWTGGYFYYPDVDGSFIIGCKSAYPDGNNDPNNFNSYNQPTNTRNRGYFKDEIVEGAGVMYLDASEYQPAHFGNNTICLGGNVTSGYVSYSYRSYNSSDSTYSININMNNSQRIVMRSDRLPTSSSEQINGSFSYALHANQNFTLFEVNDDGYVQSSGIGSGEGGPSEVDVSGNPTLSGAGDTFSCDGIIPLECYQYDENTGMVTVAPAGDDCYYNNDQPGKQKIVVNGCYVLVTTPMLSIPLDSKLIFEWAARVRLGFAACRNIFGLIFTNYWVNGTLFMFPFGNRIQYTSPPSNSPYPCICPDVAFVDHITNNVYYRSAPYRYNVPPLSTGFIGKDSPINNGEGGPGSGNIKNKPNYKNLLFPTTVMDLGPRTLYTTELVLDDSYLGYVMDRLSTTSYQDTSDLLNQFIMSRLLSQSLIGEIISSLGGPATDIVRRLFSRGYNKVDGDYAQMVAINSQIGVFPYDTDEYLTPEPTEVPAAPQGYVYTNPSSSKYNVFGVFYKQNFELRDWLSPHRLLTTPDGLTANPCVFEDYPIFTQTVPFYQWYTIENRGRDETPNPDSIFGDQRNDWWTPQFIDGPDTFFTSYYQGMDRLNSGFMQPADGSIYSFHGGFLYNVTAGQIDANPPTGAGLPIYQVEFKVDFKPTNEVYTGRIMTPSGPYYFYFGLNRGKSAFDRFLTKWIISDVFEI